MFTDVPEYVSVQFAKVVPLVPPCNNDTDKLFPKEPAYLATKDADPVVAPES